MMKFEKMENGSLRCFLTQDDLEQNGIELDDFFANTPNAREFLDMMSIQAAIMSEDEIVLTFSESHVSGAEILEHIRNMFGASAARKQSAELVDVKEEVLKEAGGQARDKDAAEYTYLLTFVSFSNVRKFCRILPVSKAAKSRLYYLDQKKQYFLWADLNRSSKKYVYEFVTASMEYAKSIEQDSMRSGFLEEHAQVIVKHKALQTLAKL